MDNTTRDISAQECFFGSVTVGERGQVVIPSDVRKGLHIEAGDRLLVFRHPIGNGIMLTKIDNVQDVIQYFQRAIERIHEVSNEDSSTEEE